MSDAPRTDADAEIDTTGLLCPLPVLKARKRLMPLEAGSVLKVLADDPMARVDFPHFCAEQGHELVDMRAGEAGILEFLIRKGA
ncbi:MAG: sulfurtransferase TusA family protein [Paracoccaceae bacterium]|nr:sulfurtransferase TusA family protein [Paracoccaceae bacterium]